MTQLPRGLARAAVGVFAAVALVVHLLALPAAYELRSTVCRESECPANALTREAAGNLERLGLSPLGFAAAGLTLLTLLVLTYLAVALLLLGVAGHRPYAVWSAAVLSGLAISFPQVTPALTEQWPVWTTPLEVLDSVTVVAFLWWLLTFPDGRLRPRWVGAVGLVATVVLLSAPLRIDDLVPGQVWLALGPPLLVIVLVVLVLRYRAHADPADRAAYRWVGASIGVAVSTLVAVGIAQEAGLERGTLLDLATQVGIVVAFLGIPVAVAAAVLRRGLWDVRTSVGRALTTSLVSVGAVAAYALTAAALAALNVDAAAGSVLAVALVTILVHPAYLWLRSRLNRALYGSRDSPGAVLEQLAAHLRAVTDPEQAMVTATETAARALRLPFAQVVRADGTVLPPRPPELAQGWPTATLALEHDGAPLGELVVWVRDADTGLEGRDRTALEPVRAQVSRLAHEEQLGRALHQSRTALVTAREEERRRLRNDLHDGLGPSLGAVAMQLSAADRTFDSDPVAARALTGQARTQLRKVIGDVRHLVRGLRPPSLDDLGLAGALRAHIAELPPGPVQVEVHAGPELSSLPAAIEVAAYRIVTEAVTNAVRHSGGSHCRVEIGVDTQACTVVVADDGRGLASRDSGVGLVSMRERAYELGGTLTISPGDGGGTVVVARLPVAPERGRRG